MSESWITVDIMKRSRATIPHLGTANRHPRLLVKSLTFPDWCQTAGHF